MGKGMKKSEHPDSILVHPYCGECGTPFTGLRKVTPAEAKGYAEDNQCVRCAMAPSEHLPVSGRRVALECLIERAREMHDDLEEARIRKKLLRLQKQCGHQDSHSGICNDCGAQQLSD